MIKLNLISGNLSSSKENEVVDCNSILVKEATREMSSYQLERWNTQFRTVFISRYVLVAELGADKVAMCRSQTPSQPFTSSAYRSDVMLSSAALSMVHDEMSKLALKLNTSEKTLETTLAKIRLLLTPSLSTTIFTRKTFENLPTDCTSIYYTCHDEKAVQKVLRLILLNEKLTSLVLDFMWRLSISHDFTLLPLSGHKSLKHLTIKHTRCFVDLLPSLLDISSLESLTFTAPGNFEFLDPFFEKLASNYSLLKLKLVLGGDIYLTPKMSVALSLNKTLLTLQFDSRLGNQLIGLADVVSATQTLCNIGTDYCSFVMDNKLNRAMEENWSICSFNTSHKSLFEEVCSRNRLLTRKEVTKQLLDLMLSAFPVGLAPYVILEVFDWIAPYHRAKHHMKIDVIFTIQQSLQKVMDARQHDGKIQKLLE